jgi:hypothetical protein
MIQRGDGACFPLETFREFLLRDFDRNHAIQSSITRLVHLAHPASANGREDLVGAEFVACGKRHTQ